MQLSQFLIRKEAKCPPQPEFCGTGRVEKTITSNHPGRVYFQTTYWPARFYQSGGYKIAFPGDSVVVIGRDGLTLLVTPAGNVELN